VNAMKAFPTDRNVLEAAARVLVLLAYNNNHNQHVIAEAGTIPILCDAICNHSSDSFVIERGVRALFNIAGSSAERRRECVMEGALSWGMSASERFSGHDYPQLDNVCKDMMERIDPSGTLRGKLYTIQGELVEVKAKQQKAFDGIQRLNKNATRAEDSRQAMLEAQEREKEALWAPMAAAQTAIAAAEDEVGRWVVLKEETERELLDHDQEVERYMAMMAEKRRALQEKAVSQGNKAADAKRDAENLQLASANAVESANAAEIDLEKRAESFGSDLDANPRSVEGLQEDLRGAMNAERRLMKDTFLIYQL
jgi:hypothetical protein